MATEADKICDILRTDHGKLGFLEKLDANAAQQLAGDLQAANQTHHEHIEKGMQEALNHFPRLLRGPIKKIFGM